MEGLDLQAFAASNETANPETYVAPLERRAI
jgi:hypothetical protein